MTDRMNLRMKQPKKRARAMTRVVERVYVVERNVPIPPTRHGPGRAPLYPWAQMKPGDSFKFAISDRARVTVAASYWKRSHPGFDYTVRGDQIWRIK